MIKTLNFTVKASQFDPEGYNAFKAAQQTADKLRGELILAFKKSDRFKAAHDLAARTNYGSCSKIEPVVWLQDGVFTVSIAVDEGDTTEKPPRLQINMDPKLVNALLHGKLLTDAEKRDLIDAIAPGVLRQAEGGEAA